ncbi:DUF2461 domain-containing protein [Humidesulfovibrio idahonensis]
MPRSATSPTIPAEALTFLAELAANNSTDWFAAHKERYESDVRGPMLRLAESLAPAMAVLDPLFVLHPASVVSRIRRDVRFSRDKSPFRSNVWLAFKRRSAEWTGYPAFFMEFGPGMFRHGMGFYSAGSKTMAALRELALEDSDGYAEAVQRAESAAYGLVGDEYKRPRVPEGRHHSVQELFRKRNVYMVCNAEPDTVVGNQGLGAALADGFAKLEPLYRFWLAAAARVQDGARE